MPKPSQRDALLQAIHKALAKAEKSVVTEVAETLANGSSFSDEQDALLLAMSDASIASSALRSEQLRLKAERDTKRAIQREGVATRNALEANLDLFSSAAAINDVSKDAARAEHRTNGSTA